MSKTATPPRPVVTEIGAPTGAPKQAAYETPEARSSFMLTELAPFALSLIATAALAAVAKSATAPALRFFADGGPAPGLMALVFFWFVFRALARYLFLVRPELQAVAQEPVPLARAEFEAGDIAELAQRTEDLSEGRSRILVGRLALAVEKLRVRRSAQELAEILRLQAMADAEKLRGERAFGDCLFWSVPVVGLVGALEAAGPGASRMLALAAALVLAMLPVRLLLQGAERGALAMIDSYLTRSLIARLRTETAEASVLSSVERLTADMAELQHSIVAVQEAANGEGERMRENIEALSAGVARAAGDELRGATSELAATLERVSTKLASAFDSGAEFTALQQGLTHNIEELGKVHDLGNALSDLKAALTALRPALECLSQPIPLRFTIEDESASTSPAASPVPELASEKPAPRQTPVAPNKPEAKPESDSPKSGFSAAATMPDPRHFGASSLLDDI